MWQQTEMPSSVTPKARSTGTELWDGGGAPGRGRAGPGRVTGETGVPQIPQRLTPGPRPPALGAQPPFLQREARPPTSASRGHLSRLFPPAPVVHSHPQLEGAPACL